MGWRMVVVVHSDDGPKKQLTYGKFLSPIAFLYYDSKDVSDRTSYLIRSILLKLPEVKKVKDFNRRES